MHLPVEQQKHLSSFQFFQIKSFSILIHGPLLFSVRDEEWWRGPFLPSFLSRLQPKLVPALEKMTLYTEEGMFDDYPEKVQAEDNISLFNLCIPSISFDSLTELEVLNHCNFKLHEEWTKVFPNVKTIFSKILNTPPNLESILGYKKLDHLKLWVVMAKGDGYVEDVNGFLSAKPTEEIRGDSTYPGGD